MVLKNELLLRLIADSKDLISKLEKSQSRIKKFGDSAFRMSQTLRRGALVSAVATGGLVAAFGNFEDSFTKVTTLLNRGDFDKFANTLKTGALDVIKNFGFTIQDTTKAMFDAVSAGVLAGEANAFLAEASRLAIGGVTTLGIAVDGLTTIINAYDLSTDKATEISNAFFTAQKYGKCFAKGTEILMFNGEAKKVEDIEVGDIIMGDDNKPRNILALGRGRETMYKIALRDGSGYTVNESHILSLKGKKGITNISIKDYLRKGKDFKARNLAYKTAIELSDKPVLIDPYLLGIWLGDGHSASPRITSADKEIVDYLASMCHEKNWLLKEHEQENNKSKIYSLVKERGRPDGCFVRDLKRYGLIDNKHIPKIYMINSKAKRLQLLAGLIDTDGSYDKKIGYEFSNKNKRLIDGLVWVARSCGFYSKIYEKTEKGIKYYRVRISGDIGRIPCKVKRKQFADSDVKRKDILSQCFTIERLGEGDYYGFEIDGNRLFVLNDMSVTHNTTVGELASTVGTVIPIAKAAGISFQEVLSALALMTKRGISTDKAATALRGAISALVKPAAQAKKVLTEMGVPTGAVELKAKGLGFALVKLNEAVEKNGDVLAQAIPNIRAFAGLASISGDALDEYDTILNDVTNDTDSLNEAFKRQRNTFNQQLRELRGLITVLSIQIAEYMIPTLKKAINFIKELGRKFEKLSPAQKEFIAKVILMTPVVLALGAALSFVVGIVTKLIPLLLFLVANPIGLLITSLVLLATAFATNFMGIRDFLVNVFLKSLLFVQEKLLAFFNLLKRLPGVGKIFETPAANVEKMISSTQGRIDAMSARGKKIAGLGETDKTKSAIDKLIESLDNLGGAATPAADGVKGVKERLEGLATSMETEFATAVIEGENAVLVATETFADSFKRSITEEMFSPVARAAESFAKDFASKIIKTIVGGSPLAFLGFQTGTDYVPRDMLAYLHEGERVIPKARAGRSEGGGSSDNRTVNITIQADGKSGRQLWDEIAPYAGSRFVRNKRGVIGAV